VKPTRLSLAVALLFLISALAARAEILAQYWTDGCSECIYEYDNASDEYRYLEKACGDGCWTTSPWISCGGNCSFHPPNPALGGYETVGYMTDCILVHVPSGKGGGISPYGGSSGTCHTFTSDAGSVIRVPNVMAGIN
jgi:hypothetical protein